MNWSGDNIRNLETITFTRNDDKTITVDHRVQQGSKEVEGSLSGTGAIDGGRLIVTTKTGREVTFSYSRISKLIELPLKNADKTPVTVKPLTEENNNDMEEIRSEIVKISQKPENKIDTTLSSTKVNPIIKDRQIPCSFRARNTAPFPEAAFLSFISFHLLFPSYFFNVKIVSSRLVSKRKGNQPPLPRDT